MLKCCVLSFFVFQQKTAYEMRIRYWSSDLCSSDLDALVHGVPRLPFRWFSGAASRLRFYDRCVTASATVEIRVADALAAQFQHDRRDSGDARLDAGTGVVDQVGALFQVVSLEQGPLAAAVEIGGRTAKRRDGRGGVGQSGSRGGA